MTDTTKVSAAFVAAQSQLRHVVATKQGQAGKGIFKYADMADLLESTRPVLAAHGLAVISRNGHDNGCVTVQAVIVHESGETLDGGTTYIPLAAGSNPQQIGSGYTYARRYSYLAALGIASDDDDGAQAMKAHEARVKADSEPKLTGDQVAVIDAIMVHAGVSGVASRLADKLEADFAAHHLPAAIEHARKQGVISDPDAVLVAGLSLDLDEVRGALAAVAA